MSIGKRKRFEILKRDGFRCRYCGRTSATVELEVDHIKPRDKGGDDSPHNLATACKACNRGKHAVELGDITLNLDDPIEYLLRENEYLKNDISRLKALSQTHLESYREFEYRYYEERCAKAFTHLFGSFTDGYYKNLYLKAIDIIGPEDLELIFNEIDYSKHEDSINNSHPFPDSYWKNKFCYIVEDEIRKLSHKNRNNAYSDN